jgi:circadian clock protein KaiB
VNRIVPGLSLNGRARREGSGRQDTRPEDRYVLSLYVAGLAPRSVLAVERIKAICERYLAGRYDLTIVDLYQNPHLARRAWIVVAPTLCKERPLPKRFLVGDMSDERRVLMGLGLRPA